MNSLMGVPPMDGHMGVVDEAGVHVGCMGLPLLA